MPPSLLRDVAATRKLLEFIYDTPNGGRSIARLARTCKAFNEPAVNVLWNELDSLLPLIGLFPSSIMKRPKRPELGLVRPVPLISHTAPHFIKLTYGANDDHCADDAFASLSNL